MIVNDIDMQWHNSTSKKHQYGRDEKHKRTRRLKEGKEVLSRDICFFDYHLNSKGLKPYSATRGREG